MPEGSIVKHLDVVIRRLGPISGFVDRSLDSFRFLTTDEGFGDGIVTAVAPPAHAWLQIVVMAEAKPIIAAVL